MIEQIQKQKRKHNEQTINPFCQALHITPTELANYLGYSRQYVVRSIEKFSKDSTTLLRLKEALEQIDTTKTKIVLKRLVQYCEENNLQLFEEVTTPTEKIKRFLKKEISKSASLGNLEDLKKYIELLEYFELKY